MAYLRLDDNFAEHPKLAVLSDAAFRVHVRGLCYASRHLTDGFLPLAVAAPGGRRAVGELVKAGVWLETAGGYDIHDFLDWNPSRAEVTDRRRKDSERKRSGTPEESEGTSDRNPDGFPGVGEGEALDLGVEVQPQPRDKVATLARRPDPVFAALVQHAEGLPRSAALTKRSATSIAVAAAEIRKAGYGAAEVETAVANYPGHFPGATCTANAIAKHIARLQEPAATMNGKPSPHRYDRHHRNLSELADGR